MATSVTPPLREKSYAELEQRISQLEQVRTNLALPLPAPLPQRSRLLTIIETIGLVAIAGAIFWLGILHSTVNSTAAKVDRLNDGIMSTSRESLSSRIAVIETRMGAVQTKLDAIDKKLDNLTAKSR